MSRYIWTARRIKRCCNTLQRWRKRMSWGDIFTNYVFNNIITWKEMYLYILGYTRSIPSVPKKSTNFLMWNIVPSNIQGTDSTKSLFCKKKQPFVVIRNMSEVNILFVYLRQNLKTSLHNFFNNMKQYFNLLLAKQ